MPNSTVQIPCDEFHTHQIINGKGLDRNSFPPLTKVRIPLQQSLLDSQLLSGVKYNTVYVKFYPNWKKCRKYGQNFNHAVKKSIPFTEFNVHGSVHRKNILIYIQQDATLHSLFYPETVLHVSGGTTTHHQERKQLYLQHLVFVTPLLLSAAIAAGSSNGVTNTRCCRYSCLSS
jgi:hypothetical protein